MDGVSSARSKWRILFLDALIFAGNMLEKPYWFQSLHSFIYLERGVISLNFKFFIDMDGSKEELQLT